MARRKKRSPPGSPEARNKTQDAHRPAEQQEKQLPPARPPAKNVLLLWTCSLLFGLWLILLVVLAATGG